MTWGKLLEALGRSFPDRLILYLPPICKAAWLRVY